jgi:Fe-S-cluster containining protein
MTEDPLRFRCTACGECCRRLRAAVTDRDLERLVRFTQKGAEALVEWLAPEAVDMTGEPESFVELAEGRRLMALKQREGACVFLAEDGRCSVHAARPRDCRQYPFDVIGQQSAREIRLLPLADWCERQSDGDYARDDVLEADRSRWAELAAYQARLAAWNRLARHRKRLGHRPRTAREFLEFLGLSAPEG